LRVDLHHVPVLMVVQFTLDLLGGDAGVDPADTDHAAVGVAPGIAERQDRADPATGPLVEIVLALLDPVGAHDEGLGAARGRVGAVEQRRGAQDQGAALGLWRSVQSGDHVAGLMGHRGFGGRAVRGHFGGGP
jgi:hypothetical protein